MSTATEKVETKGRVPLSLRVEYQDAGRRNLAFTSYLWPQGMFLRSVSGLQEGQAQEFLLHLEGRDEPVRTLGRIVRREERGASVAFEERDAVEIIRQFIAGPVLEKLEKSVLGSFSSGAKVLELTELYESLGLHDKALDTFRQALGVRVRDKALYESMARFLINHSELLDEDFLEELEQVVQAGLALGASAYLEKAKATIDGIRQELTAKEEEERRRLEEQKIHQQVEQRTQALKAGLAQRERELAELRDKIALRDTASQEQERELKGRLLRLDETEEALRRIEHMQREVTDRLEERERAIEERRSQLGSIEALARQVEDLSRARHELAEQLVSARQDVEHADRRARAALSAEGAQRQETTAALEQRIREQGAMIDGLRVQVATSEQRASQARPAADAAQVDQVGQVGQKLDAERRAHQHTRELWQEERAQWEAERAKSGSATDLVQTLRSGKQLAEQELKAALERGMKLEKELWVAREQKGTDTQATQLAELSRYKEAVEEAFAENERLESELQASQKVVAELKPHEATAKNLAQEEKRLKEQVRFYRDECDRLAEENRRLGVKQSAPEAADDTGPKLRALEEEVRALQQAQTDSETKVQQLHSELEEALEALEASESQATRAAEQEAELERLRHSIAELRAKAAPQPPPPPPGDGFGQLPTPVLTSLGGALPSSWPAPTPSGITPPWGATSLPPFGGPLGAPLAGFGEQPHSKEGR